ELAGTETRNRPLASVAANDCWPDPNRMETLGTGPFSSLTTPDMISWAQSGVPKSNTITKIRYGLFIILFLLDCLILVRELGCFSREPELYFPMALLKNGKPKSDFRKLADTAETDSAIFECNIGQFAIRCGVRCGLPDEWHGEGDLIDHFMVR